jgi:hypothetical protein
MTVEVLPLDLRNFRIWILKQPGNSVPLEDICARFGEQADALINHVDNYGYLHRVEDDGVTTIEFSNVAKAHWRRQYHLT